MIKKLTLLTLILHSLILIVVPAGHGGGPMILMELLSFPGFFSAVGKAKEFPFEVTMMIMAIFSFFGKLMLIRKLFNKKIYSDSILLRLGIWLLIIPFIIICLSAGYYHGDLFMYILLTGIPFIISAFALFTTIYKEIITSDIQPFK